MTPSENAADRARRARIFARHARAAEAGIHLPSLRELLRMQPFCGKDLRHDAQVFSERILRRTRNKPASWSPLRTALQDLAFMPSAEQCLAAAVELRGYADEERKYSADYEEWARRCEYYAASLGHHPTMWPVAGYAIDLAHSRSTPDDEAYDYAVAAVGWLLIATKKVSDWPSYWESPRTRADDLGGKLIDKLLKERDRQLKEVVEAARADTFGKTLLGMAGRLPPDFSLEGTGAEQPGVIVIADYGNKDLANSKDVGREFKDLFNAVLPLVPLPDLAKVARALQGEFPHAVNVTSIILSGLVGQHHVRMPPTILVGEPGCGKSTYAARLLQLLAIPFETYPCGGVSDASLAGTARRWSSGEPSLPLALVRRYRLASPGIILDEIEKASPNRHNGSLLDALLALLEPQTSRGWFDPYLEAAVDLSHVVWLGTANAINGVPAMLRDRCRVLAFPNPSVEHLPILAQHLLENVIESRGWDERWAIPLDQVELDALQRHWKGGSLRVLARMVEAVLLVRDWMASRH